MDTDFHSCPLWSFSLEHYAKPGVKEACLCLQDEHGLDVNVALACLWHERRGGVPLSAPDVAELLRAVEPERARVLAIRPLRREAKAADKGAGLYKALKRAELLAENLVQNALCDALATAAPGPTALGRQSLLAYAQHASATLPDALLGAFLIA